MSGRYLPDPSSGVQQYDQTGLVRLRRDGFGGMAATGGGPALVTTRPLVWDAGLGHLFVNFAGTGLQAQVLNATTLQPLPGLTFDDCAAFSGDSTRRAVSWPTRLLAVAGRPVVLQFRFTTGLLYSFWLAATPCGASRGYLAAGGPESTGGVDVHGSCSPQH